MADQLLLIGCECQLEGSHAEEPDTERTGTMLLARRREDGLNEMKLNKANVIISYRLSQSG